MSPISFGLALEKLSFKLTQKGKQEVKAEHHFETPDPDWSSFVKSLRSKHFQSAVLAHPDADDKLKSYVKNYGGYINSKDVVAKVRSPDSGKLYKLKKVGSRLGCGCGNWQYIKSVRGGDCKHIKQYESSKLPSLSKAKQAFVTDLAVAATGLGLMSHRALRQQALGQASKFNAKQLKDERRQRS